MSYNESDFGQGPPSIRRWRIDGWGLVRGLALLFSALLMTTILHHFVLAVFRG